MDQKGSSREFSPMNAIGIVATRTAERLITDILPMYPIDLMVEKKTDERMYESIKRSSDKPRTVYVAADCSRFGPNQSMGKSRCLAFALSMKAGSDKIRSQLNYELLAESTRLMENKIAKIPYNLYEMMVKMGSLEEIFRHNPISIYGKIAGYYLSKGVKILPVSMKQKWGMYQGALGMFSSLASSMLHETILEIVKLRGVASSMEALVTNDDSELTFNEVNVDLRMFADDITQLMKVVLSSGGQILNTFKTIVSTIYCEFHSRFATTDGLICPENKALFSALQIASGESIVKDSRQPIEQALSALREGASLYSAHALATLLTIKFADQYNRWSVYNKIGSQLSSLGGPLPINLLGEFMLPNYADMTLLGKLKISLSTQSKYMVASLIAEEEDGLMSLREAGLRMTTRSVHRNARGMKETKWVRDDMWIPIASGCSVGSLHSLLSSGLLSKTSEESYEDLIVRFSRNQVSASQENMLATDNSIAKHVLLKSKISYNDLIMPQDKIINAIEKISSSLKSTELIDTMVAGMYNLVAVTKTLNNFLPPISTSVKESMKTSNFSVVHPTYVKAKVRKTKEMDLESVIMNHGSETLKALFTDESKGIYSTSPIFPDLVSEYRSAMAMSSVSNKLIHHRKGNMLIIADKGRKLNVEDAVIAIARHTIRGAVSRTNFDQVLMESAQVTYLPTGFYGSGETHIEKAKQYLMALPSDSDFTFFGRLTEISNYLPFTENGWWKLNKELIKVSFLSTTVKEMGFPTRKQHLMVTYKGSGGNYTHYIISKNRSVNLASMEGIPRYLKVNKDITPDVMTKVTGKDNVKLISYSNPVKMNVKTMGNGVTWLLTNEISIPIKFDARDAKNKTPYTIRKADKKPTKADIETVVSLGVLTEENTIISSNLEVSVSASGINERLVRKGFPTIEEMFEAKEVLLPKIINKEDHDRFVSSLRRLCSLATNYTEPSGEEDPDLVINNYVTDFDIDEFENIADFSDNISEPDYAELVSQDTDEFEIDEDMMNSEFLKELEMEDE